LWGHTADTSKNCTKYIDWHNTIFDGAIAYSDYAPYSNPH
jgi:hypothetical protein